MNLLALKFRENRNALLLAIGVVFASSVHANVIGAGTQNFNATPDGLDFVTVQSAYTLDPFVINTGLFFNYAINSLPYFDNGSQGHFKLNDSILTGEVNIAVGLLPRWEIGMSVPAILAQSVSDSSSLHGFFSSTGFAEIRLNTKYQVWGDQKTAVALIATTNINRIVNDPYAGQGAHPTWNLEVAVERKFIERLAIALNLGHRWRSPGTAITPLIDPLKNQVTASVGASYLLDWADTKIISEIFAGWPTTHSNSKSNHSNSSAEFLVGLKYDYTTQLALNAGVGTELAQGVASPDYRVYTGLNYAFGPVYKRKPAPEPEPAEPSKLVDEFVARITFDFNSDKMNGDYVDTLAKLNEQLKSGFKDLLIEGHTDSVGSVKYNVTLSQKRADAIKKYLVENFKLNAAAIRTAGIGPARPIADNGNYQGRQANRRVEFKITR